MRKDFYSVAKVGGVVAALALTACSSEGDAAGSDNALPTLTSGTLTVCISKNAYEPMYWNDGGTLTGFDVDSISAIADELDLEVSFSEMAFDGLIPAVQSERCDVLRSGLYINEERSANFDTIPYLQTGPGLIVPASEVGKFDSTDSLSGARVAVQAASANEKILQELSAEFESADKPGIEFSVYPELPETIAALENGRVDATMETEVAALQAAKTLGDEYEVAESVFPADTDFGMFLPEGSELTEPIREAHVKLTEDGTLATIAEEYGLRSDRLVAD